MKRDLDHTVVDMGIKNIAPDKNFPFLLVTGVKFSGCSDDGLPTKDQFNALYQIADSIKSIMVRNVAHKLVGTFTYQCNRLDYYYIADTGSARSVLSEMYSRYFPSYKSTIKIKDDRKWEDYLEFIYPNEETMEYMENSKIVLQLNEAGDKLIKPRQVDHWLYFSTEKDRQCFIEYCKGKKFKVESVQKMKDTKQPFQLQISRTDNVQIAPITKVTLELRKQAKACNGEYDGWETFVIKE